MKEVTARQHIDAPPEQVFAQATNLEDAPQTIHSIKRLEILTDDPVGLGTRYRETRSLFGREESQEMEITRFEPPGGHTVETEAHGSRWRSRFEFRPSAGGGTDASITFTVEPLGRRGKLLGGAVMPVMRRKLIEMLEADLSDLKRAAESS